MRHVLDNNNEDHETSSVDIRGLVTMYNVYFTNNPNKAILIFGEEICDLVENIVQNIIHKLILVAG